MTGPTVLAFRNRLPTIWRFKDQTHAANGKAEATQGTAKGPKGAVRDTDKGSANRIFGNLTFATILDTSRMLFHQKGTHVKICSAFQIQHCNDSSCARKQFCMGCATLGKPYDHCFCLPGEGQSLSSTSSTSDAVQLQSIGESSRPLAPDRFPDVVKPAEQVLPILLVASDTCHESDLVAAMFMEPTFRGGTRFSSLVNFNLVTCCRCFRGRRYSRSLACGLFVALVSCASSLERTRKIRWCVVSTNKTDITRLLFMVLASFGDFQRIFEGSGGLSVIYRFVQSPLCV